MVFLSTTTSEICDRRKNHFVDFDRQSKASFCAIRSALVRSFVSSFVQARKPRRYISDSRGVLCFFCCVCCRKSDGGADDNDVVDDVDLDLNRCNLLAPTKARPSSTTRRRRNQERAVHQRGRDRGGHGGSHGPAAVGIGRAGSLQILERLCSGDQREREDGVDRNSGVWFLFLAV